MDANREHDGGSGGHARLSESDGQAGGDTLDPAIVAVLLRLREAAVERPGGAWSLAKLSKRARLPMSVLRRALTQLDAAGLTQTLMRDDATGRAALTALGRELSDALAEQ
ncbi:hypothetical protein [Burkholderia sp. TSV86]|uniref:hypothetical protein n=1 Tax=Burkholderia sp. TSV86 TaxID=1385594 RepID=UPI00075455CA|nr:hypothetical protein [Burkholderia sp. TSV86]KVE32664.1 hypothetical protein WS68_16190 [Burkholderia sp. TSV86]